MPVTPLCLEFEAWSFACLARLRGENLVGENDVSTSMRCSEVSDLTWRDMWRYEVEGRIKREKREEKERDKEEKER